MRDPMDELENFTTPGLTMDPLSPAEVRRRGNRMRHRNQALAAVGGIAAVAIIATPLALAANRSQTDTTPGPATIPPATWVQEIPADFPITDGIGGSDPQAEERTTVGDAEVGVDPIELCGAQAWAADDDTIDGLGALYAEPGTDSSNRRTLVLYADDADAKSAFAALQEAAADCPEHVDGNGRSELVEVRDAALGSEESFVVVKQFQAADEDFPALNGDIYQVARTGNALLVTAAPTANGEEIIQQEIERQAGFLAPVTEAMDVFAADN